eukprot:161247_1
MPTRTRGNKKEVLWSDKIIVKWDLKGKKSTPIPTYHPVSCIRVVYNQKMTFAIWRAGSKVQGKIKTIVKLVEWMDQKINTEILQEIKCDYEKQLTMTHFKDNFARYSEIKGNKTFIDRQKAFHAAFKQALDIGFGDGKGRFSSLAKDKAVPPSTRGRKKKRRRKSSYSDSVCYVLF